jgi:signal transduction histidine kinase
MSIEKLLNGIISATLIGIVLVLFSVVAMGLGVKNSVSHFLNTQTQLTLNLEQLYTQGLQTRASSRNMLEHPNDTLAKQNYQQSNNNFSVLLKQALNLSSITLDDPLLKIQALLEGTQEEFLSDVSQSQKMQLLLSNIEKSWHSSHYNLALWRQVKEDIFTLQHLQEQKFIRAHELFRKKVDFGIIFIVLILFAAFIVIIVVVFEVNRRIAKPLEKGVLFAEAIAKNDFSHEDMLVHKDDEFGHLAIALNSMKSELKSLIDEQQEMNRNLESKVQERTEDVEFKNRELTQTLSLVKETQKQLVESEKMASLGGLVAGIAHEVNTSIGIGVTAASHLAEKTNDFLRLIESGKLKKSDLGKYLDMATKSSEAILNNLQTATQLITSFKKIAVDQSSEVVQKIDLLYYINEVIISLRPKLKKTKISINVECDENLVLKSYPGAFSQLLTNLIVNSLVHAYEQGDEGVVKIIATSDNGRLHLLYQDDGKGIQEEYLEKIFDPFFTTKRGSGGSGLGLNIIYNLVTQKLSGSIVCKSEVGLGTSFIVDVPLEIETDQIVI